MSKKSRPASGRSLGKLDVVRAGTSYGGARWMLSAPFMVMGMICLIAFVVQLIGAPAMWFLAIPSLIGALFSFGVIALAGALFDLADCAVLAEVRAKARESREAYDTYRATQTAHS